MRKLNQTITATQTHTPARGRYSRHDKTYYLDMAKLVNALDHHGYDLVYSNEPNPTAYARLDQKNKTVTVFTNAVFSNKYLKRNRKNQILAILHELAHIVASESDSKLATSITNPEQLNHRYSHAIDPVTLFFEVRDPAYMISLHQVLGLKFVTIQDVIRCLKKDIYWAFKLYGMGEV